MINLIKKFKFFNIFVIIGFFSILLELITYNFLYFLKVHPNFADFFALLVGICFAFYFNFFYNFEVHKSKIIKAFIFFFIISFFSWSFQKIYSHYFILENLSYELTRLITSGSFFIIGYFLHRKFSFSDFKKVGIAFYLDKKLNLKKIFKSIGNNSNFIHIDIVDKSFSKNKLNNDISVLSEIKKTWPNHEIQTHIMSKKPSKILKDVIEYSDTIFIHYEINENLNELRKKIESQNKKFGVAITLKTPPKKILNVLKKATNLLILSVDDPGFSGQKFNFKATYCFFWLFQN
jgi:putative flippase GtrA|tara:strand:- start:742 stop:1614 length:873 start_codon:yes stop_codon:yes gene_type:complete